MDPTDTGGYDHSDLERIFGCQIEPGVFECLLAGDVCVLEEWIRPPHLLRVHRKQRIEFFQFTGYLGREFTRIEPGNGPDAVFSCKGSTPDIRHGKTSRSNS